MRGESDGAELRTLLAGSGRQAGTDLATIGGDAVVVVLAREDAFTELGVAMGEHALRVGGAGERERAGR